MARVKGGAVSKNRRRKVLKQAKGYFGAKSKLYRVAREAVMKSLMYSYIGRKARKRDFRKLWIARINAGCRINDISYSKFMYGLKLAGIGLNRKILSDMAISDPAGFTALVNQAKAKLN